MVEIKRETKETKIEVKLNLYGSGQYKIDTKIGFFDHMLESFSKHSLIDLEVICEGDIHVDFHHSVEDVAIVIGNALKEAIYPAKEIERFGNAVVVMDESAVECALDVSNRPFLVYEVPLSGGKVGEFDIELVEEFFRAIVFNSGLTTHLILQRGKNRHHIIEATFKAFAVALRRALSKNERIKIPSTKGVI